MPKVSENIKAEIFCRKGEGEAVLWFSAEPNGFVKTDISKEDHLRLCREISGRLYCACKKIF